MALSVDKTLSKAAKHARRGEFGEAAALYQAILEQYPANARAQRELEALRQKAPAARPPRADYERLVQLYQSGQFEEVVERATLMSRRFPAAFIVHNILGLSKAGLENWDSAITSYQEAIRLSPNTAELHNNLGIALQKTGKLEDALKAYETALKLTPGFPDAMNNLALALIDAKRYEEAIQTLESLLKRHPDFGDAPKNLATAYGDLGRVHYQKGDKGAASEAFAQALELGGDDAKAYLSYVLSAKLQPEDTHLSRMLAFSKRDGLEAEDAAAIEFALAEAFFSLKDEDKAFEHLHKANRLRLEQLKYKTSEDIERHDDFKAYFRQIGPQNITFDDELCFTPIFVLGMPRSGTTLTEQIIATHADCFPGGEMKALNDIVRQTPWYYDARAPEVFHTVRQQYRDAIRARTDAPYVVDKMPFNFRLIGVIAEAFPEAKIVHMQRRPEAVCWSNYRTFFHAETMGYCFGMEEVVRYYRLYEDLMKFWSERYGDRIFNQNYEALTEDPEAETRKLFDYLGLEWSDAVLSFHEDQRPVLTASAVQVRQKLYQGSSDAWKRYEHHLGPMLKALAAGNDILK